MTKSAEAFRTISEVADELSIPKHVLRFWEVKFPQIRPMKRGGGRRYYRPQDLDLLRGIHRLLHTEGYTIKGVQKIFRDSGVDHVKETARAEAPRVRRRKANGGAHQEALAEPGATARPDAKSAHANMAVASGARSVIAAAIAELKDCRAMLMRAGEKFSPPQSRS